MEHTNLPREWIAAGGQSGLIAEKASQGCRRREVQGPIRLVSHRHHRAVENGKVQRTSDLRPNLLELASKSPTQNKF